MQKVMSAKPLTRVSMTKKIIISIFFSFGVWVQPVPLPLSTYCPIFSCEVTCVEKRQAIYTKERYIDKGTAYKPTTARYIYKVSSVSRCYGNTLPIGSTKPASASSSSSS